MEGLMKKPKMMNLELEKKTSSMKMMSKKKKTRQKRRMMKGEEVDKSELEIEHEEELLDDEKEREIDEKENEDKEGQNEQESTSEDHDHGVSRNAHEAREEHYKADDASSAVTHETEAIDAAIKAESLENSDENNETDVLEEENKMNKTDEIWANQNNTGLAAGEGELTENGILRNVTEKEQEIQETVSSKPEESLISNSTVTTESNNEQQVVSNNTTEINPEINNLYLQNVTESKTGSVEIQNVTAADTALDGLGLQTISLGQQDNASHAALDRELPNSNSVVSHDTENAESTTEGSSNSSNATHLTTPESVQLEELSNVTQKEKAENSEGREVSRTDGRVDASKYENIEEIHHDPIDAVDTGVTLEKDVRTDLETLPEIITEEATAKMLRQNDRSD
ncbi:hypothetical protein NMG60_11014158 [Bertholletia excelsa]